MKYYDIATEKRAAFDKAMEEYIRRKVQTCSYIAVYDLLNFELVEESSIFVPWFSDDFSCRRVVSMKNLKIQNPNSSLNRQ